MSHRAGTAWQIHWMTLGIELISKMKPESKKVGRNEAKSAICEARNWFFVAAEMSSPSPSDGKRNAEEIANSARTDPRKGTWNTKTAIDAHRLIEPSPSKK